MTPTGTHPPPTPHDAVEALFEDVYWVHGSVAIDRPGPPLRISRNMVVLREGDALTVIHPIRLTPEGEAALDRLGTVRHVVRLASQHGLDDRYYVERYGAAFWCQAGSPAYPEPAPAHLLAEGGPLPVSDAELLVFRAATAPESALLLRRDGGLLITGDSLQHWADWSQCTPEGIAALEQMGFTRTTLVGPVWLKRVTPDGGSLEPDFARLLARGFAHHLGAHGSLARGTAHALVEAAVARAFPKA